MSIQEDLAAARVAAMKEGDRATLNVIRQVESEVAVAKSAPGFSGEVDDDLYRSTMASYVKRMDKARAEYEGFGERGQQHADGLAFEIDYLSQFLPEPTAVIDLMEALKASVDATRKKTA